MSDEDIIEEVLNGHPHSFRFLIGKYERLVLHMVGRMIVDRTTIEDICQEVFVRIFKNLKNYRGESKLSTWIARIAFNVCINHLRTQKKWNENEILVNEYGTSNIAEHNDPERIFEKTERKRIINEKVEALPVKYRTVLTLFYLQEFSLVEIEEITGFPKGTIKSYLYRAKALLKEQMGTSEYFEKINAK